MGAGTPCEWGTGGRSKEAVREVRLPLIRSFIKLRLVIDIGRPLKETKEWKKGRKEGKMDGRKADGRKKGRTKERKKEKRIMG